VKILVTGGTGFIGSHLIPELLERGYDVYNLERYVTGRLRRPKVCKTIFADLTDYAEICQIVTRLKPDVVIHLAAISPVSYSYDKYLEVTETNYLGTINLAEACRKVVSFKHFLFASTSETYGMNPNPPFSENSEQLPNSPYAVSKVACERYLQYMRMAFDFPVTILRPFNSYGRKADYHFVVESMIVQMLTGKKCYLGDPAPVRDFLYVDDHVNAYLTCLEQPDKSIGQVFNFCTGRGVSIGELASIVSQITGFQGDVYWNAIPSRPLDIPVLIGKNDKAREILGWTPTISLEEGLQRTVQFWKEKLGGKST